MKTNEVKRFIMFYERILGYGAGNNFGFRNIKTRYGLIAIIPGQMNVNFFKEIFAQSLFFTILGPSYISHDEYLPYGSFDNKKNIFLKEKKYNDNNLKEVDWIIQSLIDTKKFEEK